MRQSRRKPRGRELVVFVTASSKKEARAIASDLVEARLAACVTVVDVVGSIYRWKGKIEHSTETMLVIKTTTRRYADLERQVKTLHSYDVPEIIALPVVRGSRAYLEWIRHETKP